MASILINHFLLLLFTVHSVTCVCRRLSYSWYVFVWCTIANWFSLLWSISWMV